MIAEIFFIIILTLILVGVLVPLGGYRAHSSADREAHRAAGMGVAVLFYFFILFPLIWAATAWIGPYGPAIMGISWLPVLLVGIVLTLLIAAVSPRTVRSASATGPAGAATAFGALFFILVLVGLAAAIAAYI